MKFPLWVRWAPPPGLRARLVIATFAIGVAAILDNLPEIGTLAYVAWMALAILVLAVLGMVSAIRWLAASHAGRRAHAWRLALAVGAIAVLPMLGRVHDLADVARLHSRLRAQAWGHPERRGPHVAFIQTGAFLFEIWGYAYDDSGEIEKRCGTQSPEWLARVGDAQVDICSMGVSHVIGPYYRWGES